MTDWLAAARRLPNNRLVFVSTAHDFPYTMDGRRKAGLRPYVEAIRARGHIVRCAMPNEVDAIAWIRRQAALDEPRARHLLTRTGGNLALAGGVCAKLRLFHGMPNTHTIDALCAEAPTDRFVESVLARHKPAALLAAQRMPPGEYSTVIGLLTARLDLLAALWRSLRTGHPTREVRAAPVFLVQQLQPAAKHYDPERCAYYRRVLAVIEEAHRSGAREALLESLVALW